MSTQALGIGAPRAAVWTGFLLMCLAMFIAILDIQGVATYVRLLVEKASLPLCATET
jgi:hypothetical protein